MINLVSWINKISIVVLTHLEDVGSNHRPLLLDIDPLLSKAKRRLCFDARWVEIEDVQNVIKLEWNQQNRGHRLFQLHSKLKNYRHALVNWNKGNRQNSKIKINQLQNSLRLEK